MTAEAAPAATWPEPPRDGCTLLIRQELDTMARPVDGSRGLPLVGALPSAYTVVPRPMCGNSIVSEVRLHGQGRFVT